MPTITELRKLADQILLAMAVSRSDYIKNIEHSLTPVILHYYKVVLAKKMGVTGVKLDTVKTWNRQIQDLLGASVYDNIITRLKGGTQRYHLCEQACKNTISEKTDAIERDAKRKVTKAFGPNTAEITEQDQQNFWIKILEPTVRKALQDQGEVI